MADERIVFILEIENDKSIKSMKAIIDQQKELKKYLLEATDQGSEGYEKLRKKFKENQVAITEFNRDLRNSAPIAQRVEEGVTASFKKVGAVIAGAFAFDSIVSFGRQLSELTSTIEDGFARVNTVAQLSANDMNDLKNRAIEVGKLGSSELEKIPDALFDIISGTGDTELSMELLKQSVLATDAGFGDLGSTASAGVNILNAVGREAITSQELFDVLFATQREGVTTIDQLAKVLPNLIPSAKSVGFTFQETSAALAALTKQGIDAEQAGTSLRAFFSSFTNKGKLEKMNEVLGTVGSSVFDSEGKLRDLTTIVGDFDKALSLATNDAERAKIFGDLGLDQNSVKALSGLVEGLEDFQDISVSVGTASEGLGELQKQLALSENGTRSAGIAQNAFKAELLTLGQKIVPTLEEAQIRLYEAMQKGVEVINSVIDFFGRNEAAALALRNILLALGAFLSGKFFGIMLGFVKNSQLLSTVLLGLRTPLTSIIGLVSKLGVILRANPLGVAVTAITLAATAFELFNKQTAIATSKTKEFSLNSDKLAGTISNINGEMTKEVATANNLFEALKDTNISQEQRRDIINQINEQYKDYLPNLLTEKSSLNQIEAAQRAVNAALTQAFTLKIQQATQEDSLTKKINEQISAFNVLKETAAKAGVTINETEFAQFQNLVENLESANKSSNDLNLAFDRMSTGNLDFLGDIELEDFLNKLIRVRNELVETQSELTDGSIVNSSKEVKQFIIELSRETQLYNASINATGKLINKIAGDSAKSSDDAVKGAKKSSKTTTDANKKLEDEYTKLLGIIKETEDTTIKTAEATYIERKRFFDELLDSTNLTENERLRILEQSSNEEQRFKLTVRDATKKSLDEQLVLAENFSKATENFQANSNAEQEKNESDFINFIISERQRLQKEKEKIGVKEFEAGLIRLQSESESTEREINIFREKFKERRKVLEESGVEEQQIIREQKEGESSIIESFGLKAIDITERIENAKALIEFTQTARSAKNKEQLEQQKLNSALRRQQAELKLIEELGTADEARIIELKASIASLTAQIQDEFKEAGFTFKDFSDSFGDFVNKAQDFAGKVNELFQLNTDLALEGLDRQSDAAQLKIDGVQERLNVIDERLSIANATQKAALLKEREEIQKNLNQELKSAQKLEDEKEQLRKDAFERNKTFSIISAGINGALAVTKAIAELGPIAGPIAAVITAGITAAQIALIASSKFALGGLIDSDSKEHISTLYASYAEGGSIGIKFPAKRGGMIKGPSHAQGGVKFKMGGRNSSRIGEAQGGEFISSIPATNLFYPVFDYLNSLGNSLGKSSVVSMVPSITRVPPRTNFADGGQIIAQQAFITRAEFIQFAHKLSVDTIKINDTLQTTNKLLVKDRQVLFSIAEFQKAYLLFQDSENSDDE